MNQQQHQQQHQHQQSFNMLTNQNQSPMSTPSPTAASAGFFSQASFPQQQQQQKNNSNEIPQQQLSTTGELINSSNYIITASPSPLPAFSPASIGKLSFLFYTKAKKLFFQCLI